jgi:hypothetical protein
MVSLSNHGAELVEAKPRHGELVEPCGLVMVSLSNHGAELVEANTSSW